MTAASAGREEEGQMIAELEERFAALEGRLERLAREVATLDEAQLEFAPREGVWCASDVVQHLVLVEELMLEQATDPAFRFRTRPGRIRRLKLRAVWFVLRHGLRVKAPTRRVVPEQRLPARASLERFVATRRRLRELLERQTPESARAATFEHPIGGPLDVVQGLDLLNMHFDHHFRQLERIRNAPGFPPPAPPPAG